MSIKSVPVGQFVGFWTGHPRRPWLGKRVAGPGGLAGTSFRNCSNMTKSPWWDAAELALSSLRRVLLGLDTSPEEKS